MRSTRSPEIAGSALSRSVKLAVVVVAAAVVSFGFVPGLLAQTTRTPDEATSVALVNAVRSAAGVQTLAANPGLDVEARAQAARMAARNGIYHNPNLQSDADAQGVNWQLIGENVGMGPDVQAIHDAFMASPHHHENIVYPSYNAIGVGVVKAINGTVFVAHVFADVVPTAPPVGRVSPASSRPAASTVHPVAVRASAPAPVLHKAPAHRTSTPGSAVKPASPLPNAIVGGIVDRKIVF